MTVSTRLDGAYVDELFRRQDALQAEASRVINELDLMNLLGRAGRAEQVGSVVSGLMVWRDIDVGAVSPGLSVDGAWEVMRPIIGRAEVTRVSFANESGHLNTSGRPYDDRHYFVIHYETATHDDWKIDITIWLIDGPREQRARALAMTHLPRETRVCILWLKDLCIGCRYTHTRWAAPTSTTRCLSTVCARPMNSTRTCASAACRRAVRRRRDPA